MATAKIATLLIRTIAKPIATQLKQQAQHHESFKNMCVALAQRQHRIEMALRSNLMGGTAAHTKVRPLNEKRAIDNGAAAISEGFLFAIAAALIIGESYRGSRSNKKQRDRTEDAVDELRDAVELLGERLGVGRTELWREGTRDGEDEAPDKGEAGVATGEASTSAQQQERFELEPPEAASAQVASRSPRTRGGERSIAEIEHDRERLQHAVAVLLRLALRSGWVEGPEALRLGQILDGSDAAVAAGSTARVVSVDAPPRPAQQSAAETAPAKDAANEEPRTRASIMDEVARARAKAIVDEVRRSQGAEAGAPAGPSLAQLLERAGLDREEAQNAERPSAS